MTQQQPKEYIITEEQLDHFVTCAAHDDCTGCKYSAPEFVCVPRIMANKVRSRPAPASAPEDAFAFMRNDQIKKWQDRQICPHSWVRKNGKYRCFASYMGWDCPMIGNDDVRCEVYE